jgi:DNA repair photolyase
MSIPLINNKSILTPTSGFLGSGFTHTINIYSGCAFANSVCGLYCYAQHNHWITKGRPWGMYGAKENVASAYEKEFDRLKRPRNGSPKFLRIYMSSSTDPYVPQEKSLRLTRSLLEAMVVRPPDGLVVQTHATLIERDLEVIKDLATRTAIWVSITVETDQESLPGFPKHASSVAARLDVLRRFRKAGLPTQATVSPLLPLANVTSFAQSLDQAADRVVVDHYLLGDGSKGGWRTRQTEFPQLLEGAGLAEWNSLDKFWQVVSTFRTVLGADRVLVSEAGFNTA